MGKKLFLWREVLVLMDRSFLLESLQKVTALLGSFSQPSPLAWTR